jgi:hypothetical protein
MYAGAKETEVTLKKKLAETKDQVRIPKERTAELRQGRCRVHCGRAIKLVITGWRASY